MCFIVFPDRPRRFHVASSKTKVLLFNGISQSSGTVKRSLECFNAEASYTDSCNPNAELSQIRGGFCDSVCPEWT